MDCRTALKCFYTYLQEFEKNEILDYETIYWFNIDERKSSGKAPGPPHPGIDNNGYDNDK